MVSGYPTSTNIRRVDRLSTGPLGMGRHIFLFFSFFSFDLIHQIVLLSPSFFFVLFQVGGSFISPSFILSPLDIWLYMSHSTKCHVSLATPHGYHAMCLSPKVSCGIHMWHYSLWHPTPSALKNVKFRLSQNIMKFDWVTRFRETIPTVKSVLSSKI